MCGIAGAWGGPHSNRDAIDRMAASLDYRGPDARGQWHEPDDNVALGHRRLSIIDLSPAGSQPMVSPCGRYALVFNGEIYNHRTVRSELDALRGGFDWRGHSDTETLLAALRYWGGEQALTRINGMFAFAL